MTHSQRGTRKAIRSAASFAFLLLLAVGVSGLSPAIQRDQLRLILDGDRDHPITVSSYKDGGLTYVPLDELAAVLGVGTFWNEDVKKLEFRLNKYRVKFSGDNPFVVIADATTNRVSVHQFAAPVQLRAKSISVPITFFLPVLNGLHEKEVTILPPSGAVPPKLTPPSTALDITGVTVEEKTNGYVLRIAATRRFDEFECWPKPDGWLYVTIPDAKADIAKLNAMKATNIFNKVVAIQYPTSVQLTFKLTRSIASSEIVSDPSNNDILVSLRLPSAADSLAAEVERSELLSRLEGVRNRWKLDVIVIDAGHGGNDPGTIGVTGVKEKDITLEIALKLGRLIERNLKDVKVIYTRKTDTFIELYRRGQIANAAGGKLFISIHCNSMRRKPHYQNGFEIYLLRPGRTEDAVRIAERENAVIKLEQDYERRYQELTEENFILVTMAQSAHMKYSERFAEFLQQEMGNRLPLADNGVKQAGFLVLVGASMPNILVETGYLSNRNDERYLKSKVGQERIAEAIFTAVKKYKSEYERALDEGKASN
jgi:N-acetylmuramoyl-L-alanine amidase